MVPPCNGCGWQTSAARRACGSPLFSSASSLPAGPETNSDLISPATEFFQLSDFFHFLLRNEVEIELPGQLHQGRGRRGVSGNAPAITFADSGRAGNGRQRALNASLRGNNSPTNPMAMPIQT